LGEVSPRNHIKAVDRGDIVEACPTGSPDADAALGWQLPSWSGPRLRRPSRWHLKGGAVRQSRGRNFAPRWTAYLSTRVTCLVHQSLAMSRRISIIVPFACRMLASGCRLHRLFLWRWLLPAKCRWVAMGRWGDGAMLSYVRLGLKSTPSTLLAQPAVQWTVDSPISVLLEDPSPQRILWKCKPNSSWYWRWRSWPPLASTTAGAAIGVSIGSCHTLPGRAKRRLCLQRYGRWHVPHQERG
jgi:hypothetical protein